MEKHLVLVGQPVRRKGRLHRHKARPIRLGELRCSRDAEHGGDLPGIDGERTFVMPNCLGELSLGDENISQGILGFAVIAIQRDELAQDLLGTPGRFLRAVSP